MRPYTSQINGAQETPRIIVPARRELPLVNTTMGKSHDIIITCYCESKGHDQHSGIAQSECTEAVK
jgi:hypothetical protein